MNSFIGQIRENGRQEDRERKPVHWPDKWAQSDDANMLSNVCANQNGE